MHGINIKIISAQQAENSEFIMEAVKPGCIRYGTALREFQQTRSWRFVMLFPQEKWSTAKQRTVIKLVTKRHCTAVATEVSLHF